MKVTILHDHPQEYVVACFDDRCPEHGVGAHCPPWVDEFDSRKAAEVAAREHRQMIRDYWTPDPCPKCGQRVPKGAEA